jgi:hypothetical protein
MITVVLFSITALFFLFIFIKPFLDRLLNFRICTLCASVAATWLSMLLIHWFTPFPVDTTLLAILMGCSVVGIMYRFSAKTVIVYRPLTGLFFLLSGTTLAYFLITLIFDPWSLAVLISVFVLAYCFEISRKKRLSSLGKKLEKRLEHCCS